MISKAVEFVWSRSGSDEAFLADMKAAMKDGGVEAMKIVYDPPSYDPKSHTFLGDSCAPWLAFLKDHVNSPSIKKIVFDVPFTTKIAIGKTWYNFTSYGDANKPFQFLMDAISDAARQRGVDVTMCGGIKYLDMDIISVGPNPNPTPETTNSPANKPEAKIAGHKRHPETLEIVAVEGVSNGAWTHFDVAETSHFELAKTSYSISVPVPEGLTFDDIRVAVDANGKSVKIGNVPRTRWDSPPPKIRMDCSFFIPNDALVPTIRARKADGKVVVCMDRGKSVVMPDEGIADERVISIE